MTEKRQRKRPKYLRDDEEDNQGDSEVSRSSKPSKKRLKHLQIETVEKTIPKRTEERSRPGIKLKFKLGGKTVGTSVTAALPFEDPSEDQDEDIHTTIQGDGSSVDIDGEDGVDDSLLSYPEDILANGGEADDVDGGETSEEEREWLQAVESGDLESYERKKAEKNPALLTARQRALISGSAEEELLELPSLYKSGELTEEQLQRRKQRAVKRRQQAIEQREKAKKQTVDRLLNKQEPALRGRGAKTVVAKVRVPHCRYLITAESMSISLPPGIEFPLARQISSPPKPVIQCAIPGCSNPKRYNCSQTGVPLCSLECYKQHHSAVPITAS